MSGGWWRNGFGENRARAGRDGACVSSGCVPLADDADEFSEFSWIAGGANPNDVGATLETIFATTAKDPWPARPWLWADIARTDSIDGSLSMGVKASGFGVEAGATNTMTFETGHTTTAVFIATMRDPNQRLTRFDEVDKAVRFNIEPESRLVGICIYSSFLVTSDRAAASLKFAGNGVETAANVKETITRATHSHLFEIDPVKAPSYYVNELCETAYQSKVRAAVVEDLKNLVYDSLVFSSSATGCLVPATRGESGDDSCLAWHQGLIGLIQPWTVPRCEADSAGNQRCVLRSKTGNACPLYRGADSTVYAYPAQGSSRITAGMFEYVCDPYTQKSCYMTEDAGWFSHAKSECR